MTKPAPCPSCQTLAAPVPRGLTGVEVAGTLALVLLTCGLAFPVVLGLPLLASRKVCPACKVER